MRLLLSLWPYGSRNFEMGSCRQHGFAYKTQVDGQADKPWLNLLRNIELKIT